MSFNQTKSELSDPPSGSRDVPNPLSQAERLVLLAVFIATLAFVAITPPFEAPDEPQHFMRAVQLSQGSLFADTRKMEAGKDLPKTIIELYDHDFTLAVQGSPRIYRRSQLDASWNADHERPGKAFASFPNVANYSPTLYLPQAGGIWMAQVLGLPALGAFYAARLVNALTAMGLLTLALKNMPFGRNIILTVAVVPTAAYQAGSLSPDATINTTAFLALALSLRLRESRSRLRGEFAALPCLSILLGLAKGVYLPVLLAGLRWSFGPHRRRAWLIIASAIIAALAFVGWMKAAGGTQATYSIVSRKTGLSVRTAPFADQLNLILSHPLAFCRILFGSLAERAPIYALQIIGRFGWNAILLPLLSYPLALLMGLCGLWGSDSYNIAAGRRLWFLTLAFASELFIEIALYLTGTPRGADYIQGVQGRYMLPLLPLIGLALLPGTRIQKHKELARWGFAASAIILALIGLMTVFDSFWIHGFTIRDGMPPISRDTAGLIRALLLPSPRW